ncbi:MAG TPA: hypothetical protein VL992_21525 [Tepidisphaeraceae bacterium]|nr:hypothetical protein [Tepidisphaeraceae bacterium]
MVSRNALVAAMFMGAASLATAGLADQRGDAPPSSPYSAGYSYPTQQALGYGVYDLTQVEANKAVALEEEDQAELGMTITVIRLQKEFETSPEYKAAAQELDQAHQALDNARRSVIDQVSGDPRYQELTEKHDRLAAVIASGGLTTRDLYDLAERKMQYGSDAMKLEAAALDNNSDVQSARSRLISAQQKMDDLRDRFQTTLYQNPQWASAKQTLDNARIARSAALGAENGAFITANLAYASSNIRSSYGYYNAGDFSGYGYGYGGSSGGYYPRY